MLILVEVLPKLLFKSCLRFYESVYSCGFGYLALFILFQKDELKKILTTKEKQQEESLRTIEALKAKLKYYEVR